MRPIYSNLDRTSLVRKKESFLPGPMWGIPSGLDGPISVANQNTKFASSCPLLDSAIQ